MSQLAGPHPPATLSEFVDWLGQCLKELDGQEDRPVGGSGKAHMPVASLSAANPVVTVQLHSPSPLYVMRECLLDGIERLLPPDAANQLRSNHWQGNVKTLRRLRLLIRDCKVAALTTINADTPSASHDADGEPPKPVESQAETLASGDGAGDELQKRVASLERQEKKRAKPLTKTEKTRNQRIKFCCPRRRKNPPDTWNEIYHDYAEKFPNDKTASPDSLLHSHDRNCLKCREQKS